MHRATWIALWIGTSLAVACDGEKTEDSGASADDTAAADTSASSDDTSDTAAVDTSVDSGLFGLFQDVGAFPGTAESDAGYFQVDVKNSTVGGPIRWGGYSFQRAMYLCSWLYESSGILVTPCPECDFSFEVTQTAGVEYASGDYCDYYRDVFWDGAGVESLDGLTMTWGFKSGSDYPDEYGQYAPASLWYYSQLYTDWYVMEYAYSVFTEGGFDPDRLYFYVYWDEGYYYQ